MSVTLFGGPYDGKTVNDPSDLIVTVGRRPTLRMVGCPMNTGVVLQERSGR